MSFRKLSLRKTIELSAIFLLICQISTFSTFAADSNYEADSAKSPDTLQEAKQNSIHACQLTVLQSCKDVWEPIQNTLLYSWLKTT